MQYYFDDFSLCVNFKLVMEWGIPAREAVSIRADVLL